MLRKEAFSFTYEVEAMSKEEMGVIDRCGYVREVDSRTEWVLGREVMGSVCETDNGGADGTDNGDADDCADNGGTDDGTDNDVSHANPDNATSHNDSNRTANCSTTHI